MKVIAIRPGYHGRLRETGEQFDVPDGSRASWFAPADGAATVIRKPDPPAPTPALVPTPVPVPAKKGKKGG
jgi:hypothetical protein